LLIVLVGRSVKLASFFSSCDKHYRGRLKLGEETDTLDPEGRIIARAELCTREAFERLIPAFTGNIMQAPPLFSAIHINGERAHKIARRLQTEAGPAMDGGPGIEGERGAAPGISGFASNAKLPEMEKRPVTIYSLALVAWEPPFADIEVHCSKGTYIRSLARDMALAAGSRAHLVQLRRTAVGNFSVEDAVAAPAAADAAAAPAIAAASAAASAEFSGLLEKALKAPDQALFSRLSIPVISIDEKAAAAISGGKTGVLEALGPPADAEGPEGAPRPAAVFGPGDVFSGMIEWRSGAWKYRYVNADN
jgi:tRNA pseudouridine55 synthase